MNIYWANARLKELIASSTCQNLESKFGKKTPFYIGFTSILDKANIPYSKDNLIEVKWRVLNLDFNQKICQGCNNEVKFVSLNKGFRKYCSASCGASNRDATTRGGFTKNDGWQKSRETMYKRYGVYHQAHVTELFEKQQNNRYKTYSIVSPNGIEYKVQGYERFVIPMLWKKYNEDDVIVKKSFIPKIKYSLNNKFKKYYPDCYIKSSKIIVEVKSTYTIKDDTLIPKLEGCLNAGFTPIVYLYNKGNILELSIDGVKKYLGL